MHRLLLLIPACSIWAVPASADELPQRKSGLWEVSMAVGGKKLPFGNVQHCTDKETDAEMMTNFKGAAGMLETQIQNDGGTITIDFSCTFRGSTTRSRAVITGDLNSAYTIKVSESSGDAPQTGQGPDGGMSMTLDAKWIGPCGPKMKAGDIMMPGGITMNIRQLKGRTAAPGK